MKLINNLRRDNMEPNVEDTLQQIMLQAEEKKYNEYLEEQKLRKEHKKMKQLLRGNGTYNAKRIKERQELLKKMKNMIDINNIL
jgi:hypothetical protein